MGDILADLEILDHTGGVWAALPIFALFEFMFFGLLKSGIDNHVQYAPKYSIQWGIYILIFLVLISLLGIFITMGIAASLKSSGKPRCLRINKTGVSLPYNSATIIWNDIDSYFTKEVTYRGGHQFLYIVLVRPRASLDNPFRLKKIMILGRGIFDNEDMRNCINLIDHYLTAKERPADLRSAHN